ncbi:uncharacterized protein [Parasteatoda tepidariorum]|uniref:uncharacterized protein n=1 Tax=Parasteatoda tepidariorum TaxID=114398 RepID=UPI000A2C05D8|nr:uncharacterized protein LOC110282188 [Parasteatoda tepidariorum]
MSRKFKKDIVPWKNPAEFIKVYEYAFSDDLKKNRWAVEQITVWETRCWPSLPTAVEATLLLVRSKIQDHLYEASKFFCNAQEVEMMYSNAVVRFVNLLLENDQNSRNKKRLFTLAEERNIPPWIVDIRHNSTHGFHPTLPILRMAYETIMAYLEKIFWLPEKSRVCAIIKFVDEAPIVELLEDYKLLQYQMVANIVEEGIEDKEMVHTGARDKVLLKIDEILRKPKSQRKFLDILVENFITLYDVQAMITEDEIFMDDNISPSSMMLPATLQHFYNPLIKLLHKHNLISTFLELLLLSQEKREYVVLQKIVDYAVLYIFHLTKASGRVSKQTAMPFVCKGANLNKYRLLYSCVKGCSTTVRVVFEWLVDELELMHFVPELTAMINIKLGTSIRTESGTMRENRRKRKFDEFTFTVEDLEEDVLEVVDTNSCRKKGHWSLAPLSTDWASTPIGHVFHPVDITKKDEPTHEGETSSAENIESMHTEESKPVATPQPENFIFKESPNFTSMLYRRKSETMLS